jgi:hypothetical protein
MTAGSKIDYEALAQEALRGVVRTVLSEVARTGLPGDHHFYISFDTQAAGASLSKRLREKYPEEMTIVLQHRFWDLIVLEDRFEVKLTFDGIPEKLVIPFAAIRVFFDPSVRYGLQFEDTSEAGPDSSGEGAGETGRPMVVTAGNSESGRPTPRVTRTGDRRPKPARKPKAEKPAEVPSTDASPAPESKAPTPLPAAAPVAAMPKPTAPAADAETKKSDGAQVVSLDAFRKK